MKSIFIRLNENYHRVNISDITHISSDVGYVEVFTSNNKFLVRSSLENFAKRLGEAFKRVHRSHFVNVSHLELVNHTYVLVDGKRLPIGRQYRKGLLAGLELA